MRGAIKIKRETLGDTRVATRVPTFPEFDNANNLHRSDVRNMMNWIAEAICDRGSSHDRMKLFEPGRSMFYRELCAAIEGRHHLNSHCPDDVNLIDVIEMICDCVCAGMARSGAVRPVEIRTEILQKAVENTAKMLSDTVILEESDA